MFINSFFGPSSIESRNYKNSIDNIGEKHYITIKEEMRNQEKTIVNGVNINKLTIKNATNKDAVCF